MLRKLPLFRKQWIRSGGAGCPGRGFASGDNLSSGIGGKGESECAVVILSVTGPVYGAVQINSHEVACIRRQAIQGQAECVRGKKYHRVEAEHGNIKDAEQIHVGSEVGFAGPLCDKLNGRVVRAGESEGQDHEFNGRFGYGIEGGHDQPSVGGLVRGLVDNRRLAVNNRHGDTGRRSGLGVSLDRSETDYDRFVPFHVEIPEYVNANAGERHVRGQNDGIRAYHVVVVPGCRTGKFKWDGEAPRAPLN